MVCCFCCKVRSATCCCCLCCWLVLGTGLRHALVFGRLQADTATLHNMQVAVLGCCYRNVECVIAERPTGMHESNPTKKQAPPFGAHQHLLHDPSLFSYPTYRFLINPGSTNKALMNTASKQFHTHPKKLWPPMHPDHRAVRHASRSSHGCRPAQSPCLLPNPGHTCT